MIESVNRVLAVALLATGLGLLTVDACAAPRAQAELSISRRPIRSFA
jgi:hypothetical protein